MTEFHTQYTERSRVQTINDEPSMTHQSFQQGQDVNFIIDRYVQSGHPLPLGPEGYYGDVSNAEDYSTLMNNLTALHTAFEALPDEIRQEFQSPEDWINASLDEERLSDIMERLNSGESEGGSSAAEATSESPQQDLEEVALAPPAQ